MNRFLTTLAVFAFAGLALAGCNKKSNASAASSGGKSATLTLIASGDSPNFKFDKTDLTATAGESVTFVVKNESASTEHNLTIEDLKVNKDVEAGKTAQQTVANLKAGTYQYHCEYHPNVMHGTLTVS